MLQCYNTEVIVPSILPAGGRREIRKKNIVHMSSRLYCSYWHKDFVFYDPETLYEGYHVLGKDRIHLPRRGRETFGKRLAKLVGWALN